jgi:hypothetical protein
MTRWGIVVFALIVATIVAAAVTGPTSDAHTAIIKAIDANAFGWRA